MSCVAGCASPKLLPEVSLINLLDDFILVSRVSSSSECFARLTDNGELFPKRSPDTIPISVALKAREKGVKLKVYLYDFHGLPK